MESVLDRRFELRDLLDAAVIGDVVQAASSCFNLGITIIDLEGRETLAACPDHEFCLAAKGPGGPGRCNEVKAKLAGQPLDEGQVLQIKSFCGLRYAIFPLSYQLDLLGRVVIGPFRDPGTAPAAILELIGVQGGGLDQEKIEKIPTLAPDRLRLIIRLLARFFDAFLFVNAKRLLTSSIHLETIFNSREAIFRQMERQDQGTREDKEEIERLKDMF